MITLNSATFAVAVFLVPSIMETRAATIEDGLIAWMEAPGKPAIAMSADRDTEIDSRPASTTAGARMPGLRVSRSGTPETTAFGRHDPFSKSDSVTGRLLPVANVDIRIDDNTLRYIDVTFDAFVSTWSSVAFRDASPGASFMFRTTGDLWGASGAPGFPAESAIDAPLPKIPLPIGATLVVSGLVALFGLHRLGHRAT
ncbi:hypothetical protein [Paenirhodobacter populi]|uniref:Uncharacterized protein n=1 Tax=Paenirhodobacter populi TaxID=2306993 RepID=A0A443IQ86_9RHOB|nr:hypothetical protein [Sinirhodobacter populi]RWR08167.1 hypothetical protein D2T33_16205 [Sinirhodobacter populi]